MKPLPLGVRIDLSSGLPLPRVRRRILEGLAGWLSSPAAPRGYAIGNLFVLWHEPHDRFGPMVIGWLRNDGARCRFVGRAGSDLNGAVAILVMLPFMVWQSLAQPEATFPFWVWLLAAAGLFCVLWARHDEAEPLVAYLVGRLAPDAADLSPPVSAA